MIVEPDFLDHWKTRMLARLLKDERAPIYVIRLWAHCQQRKTDRFTDWNPDVLASVCRWETDGLTLWEAMGKTFIEINGSEVVVHGWAETNAALLSAWANGRRGGRPKAVNTASDKPTGNPPVIPGETDRVSDREEKRREDREDMNTPIAPKGARFAKPSREELDLHAAKIGLPANEVDAFVNYFESNGWKVGKNPMKSWPHALATWAARWRERNAQPNLINGGGRHGQPSAAEQRNRHIMGGDAVREQAIRTAEAERALAESGCTPWD